MSIPRGGAARIRTTRRARALVFAALTLSGVACESAKENGASEPKWSEEQASAAAPPSGAERTCPPRPPRFWERHPGAWPLASLTLGGLRYTEAELLAILRTPLDDDASVILGRPLIAALLDVANGTDPAPVSATIADANARLTAGRIPLGVPIFSPLGLRMVEDAAILEAFTHGRVTRACAPPVGACEAWSRVSVLAIGRDVVAYVARGTLDGPVATGISVVNVEGTRVAPTLIPTPDAVNSCASNPLTGRTVCTANDTNVYLLSGTTLDATLTSGADGSLPPFECANCGVTMDAIHDRALLGMNLSLGVGGFQFLDLGSSPSFEPAFVTETSFDRVISTGALVDPYRNRILSPTEGGLFELIDVAPGKSPAFFENLTGGTESAGEDCATQIAAPGPLSGLGPPEPATFLMTDLSQATFTPGSPGSWTAPLAYTTLAASGAGKWGAVAVAQGTHTAVFSGARNANQHFFALVMPATSGSGTPAPVDYVACDLPFATDFVPQSVAAYKTANGGDAMAVIVDASTSVMAVVDLTKLLDPTIVPRTAAGHRCASVALPASVLRLVTLP
jgi:hypothetical protein